MSHNNLNNNKDINILETIISDSWKCVVQPGQPRMSSAVQYPNKNKTQPENTLSMFLKSINGD